MHCGQDCYGILMVCFDCDLTLKARGTTAGQGLDGGAFGSAYPPYYSTPCCGIGCDNGYAAAAARGWQKLCHITWGNTTSSAGSGAGQQCNCALCGVYMRVCGRNDCVCGPLHIVCFACDLQYVGRWKMCEQCNTRQKEWFADTLDRLLSKIRQQEQELALHRGGGDITLSLESDNQSADAELDNRGLNRTRLQPQGSYSEDSLAQRRTPPILGTEPTHGSMNDGDVRTFVEYGGVGKNMPAQCFPKTDPDVWFVCAGCGNKFKDPLNACDICGLDCCSVCLEMWSVCKTCCIIDTRLDVNFAHLPQWFDPEIQVDAALAAQHGKELQEAQDVPTCDDDDWCQGQHDHEGAALGILECPNRHRRCPRCHVRKRSFFTCYDCERIACTDACLVMINDTPYCKDCG